MTAKPKEPAELTPEREAAIVALLGLYDCGDSSCMLRYPRGPSKGMRTNGGCRCLERDREAQRTAWRLHQAAALLLEEVTRLRAERAADPVRRFLAHPLAHRIDRGFAVGEGGDTDDRYAASWGSALDGYVYETGRTPDEACEQALQALDADQPKSKEADDV